MNYEDPLMNICSQIALLEGQLLRGEVRFSYDKLFTVLGKGHPAEILDEILSPVYWPVMNGKMVDTDILKELYENLRMFNNDFQIKELVPMISQLKSFLNENGVMIDLQKINF